MTNIPIVFAFDDNYKIPAYVAINSLMSSKKPDTNYRIFVFDCGISHETKKEMEKIAPIQWLHFDLSQVKNYPNGYSGLGTYARLFIADQLNYDKIIYSDVDVVFKKDLSDIYQTNMTGYDWAGPMMETKNETKGPHSHFPENHNDFIYSPGFMIINAKRWRDNRMLARCQKIIATFNKRLLMYDLDVLNLASSQIKAIPLTYCALENLRYKPTLQEMPEYSWLKNVYSDQELLQAKNDPAIVHYAGGVPKVWRCPYSQMHPDYLEELKKTPYYTQNPLEQEFLPALVSYYMFTRHTLGKIYHSMKAKAFQYCYSQKQR